MYTAFAKHFGFLLLAITLLMILGRVASATTVSLKVETVEGSGSSIETPISTGSCEGLGALQFDLTYDPTVVEPESVEPGSALPNGLVEFKVKSPGVLGIALISSAPVNGSGELLNVRFKPVAAEGGNTTLKITGETAWDFENNVEMLVTAEPGSLSVTPGKPASELLPNDGLTVLVVIGGILLLLVILIIVLAKRKRKPRTATASPSAENQIGKAAGGFCEKCGAKHAAGAQFCPQCGQAINPSA